MSSLSILMKDNISEYYFNNRVDNKKYDKFLCISLNKPKPKPAERWLFYSRTYVSKTTIKKGRFANL